MKRNLAWRMPVLLALVLVLVLGACGSDELVNSAYTAAGDGTRPQDLTQTKTLRSDDDLNVVVLLASHRRELEVAAQFNAPDGSVYATDTLEADETVGKVVLGLDWESQNGVPWTPGEWTVDVVIDEKVEATLTFTVAAAPEAGDAQGQ